MADDTETDTPMPAAKPRTPRRRASTAAKTPSKPRAVAKKSDAPAASTSAARAKPTTPPKPRSTKRATPAPKRRAPAKLAATASPEKSESKWGAAAVVGGIAAIGAAATAALLSLRGSTPKGGKSQRPTSGAHTPDGADASKSFEAGIADENSIPDKQ